VLKSAFVGGDDDLALMNFLICFEPVNDGATVRFRFYSIAGGKSWALRGMSVGLAGWRWPWA
jgi:hypothetical protein